MGKKINLSYIAGFFDGNGLNNDITNLKIVSWAEHNRIHLKK